MGQKEKVTLHGRKVWCNDYGNIVKNWNESDHVSIIYRKRFTYVVRNCDVPSNLGRMIVIW